MFLVTFRDQLQLLIYIYVHLIFLFIEVMFISLVIQALNVK